MRKNEFLACLEDRLKGLPEADIRASVDYYSEIIDDLIEDGTDEETAVGLLGSVVDIASQIMMDTSLPKLVKAKVKPKRSLRAWEIILLILGAPLWIPLIAACVVIALAVYIVLWSVVVVFYAADLCLAAGALIGVAGTVLLLVIGEPIVAFMLFGAGLACAGLSIFAFFGCGKTVKGMLFVSKSFIKWIKSLFIGKGDKK